MLRTWVGEVRRQQIDVVGEVLPRAGDAWHLGLAAEPPFGADFARDARHFAGKRPQLIDRRVERFLELQKLAANVDGDLLGQVAIGNRRGYFGDVADLSGQVRSHQIDVVGQVLPGAGDFRHLRLTAQFAFSTDFARDARHLRGERIQLVHHGVDGVLQLENFAFHVDRDFPGQIAARHSGRHLGDVSDLSRQIAGHRVHRVGEILPGTGDTRDVGLAAEPSLGADFAGDARHFAGEGVELVHHRIDGFFELQDFTRHADGDFLRQVAAGDSRCYVGDIADLSGQIARP